MRPGNGDPKAAVLAAAADALDAIAREKKAGFQGGIFLEDRSEEEGSVAADDAREANALFQEQDGLFLGEKQSVQRPGEKTAGFQDGFFLEDGVVGAGEEEGSQDGLFQGDRSEGEGSVAADDYALDAIAQEKSKRFQDGLFLEDGLIGASGDRVNPGDGALGLGLTRVDPKAEDDALDAREANALFQEQEKALFQEQDNALFQEQDGLFLGERQPLQIPAGRPVQIPVGDTAAEVQIPVGDTAAEVQIPVGDTAAALVGSLRAAALPVQIPVALVAYEIPWGEEKRIRFEPLPVRRLCFCAGSGLCIFITNPTLLGMQVIVYVGVLLSLLSSVGIAVGSTSLVCAVRSVSETLAREYCFTRILT